ncbi:hypothetical protein HanPSC8_Chr05g0190871 [Helianthus annuus]|nr:hypothetical protein HanPSC8_Chr05g0190871 [Helianthus annuus]
MSLKLPVLDPFLLTSDSKSSLVSSLIVNRNLGGPHRLCSLMSSRSKLSSPNPFNTKSLPKPMSESCCLIWVCKSFSWVLMDFEVFQHEV